MSRPKPKAPRTGAEPAQPQKAAVPDKEKLSDYEKAIADRLRFVRDLRGVTSKWLSAETQISRPTMSRLLNGIQRPHHELVHKVCRALEVRIDFISDISIAVTKDTIRREREIQRTIESMLADADD